MCCWDATRRACGDGGNSGAMCGGGSSGVGGSSEAQCCDGDDGPRGSAATRGQHTEVVSLGTRSSGAETSVQQLGSLGGARDAAVGGSLKLTLHLRGGCGATQVAYDDSDDDEAPPPALVPIVDCVQRPEDAEALPVIEGGALTIGRGDDVILNLTDGARPSEAAGPGQPGQLVHRQHARVVLRGGAYWLDVQGSQMLTRVGSIAYRCVPGLPQLQLAHGDEIIFGGAPKGPDADYRRFRFVVDAPEALQPDREAHPLPQMPAQPVRRPVMPLQT